MSATISTASRVYSASKFIQGLYADNDTFFFAGRIHPWTDENSPDTSSLDYAFLRETKTNIAFIKKISSDPGMLGLKRYDYVSGTIYTEWDPSVDLGYTRHWLSPTQPFYVYVQDDSSGSYQYNVYMCIDNNLGAPSTVKPTGQNIDVFTTADDYKWKFMYNIKSDYLDFISPILVPCPLFDYQKSETHLITEANVKKGTIDRVKITDPGSGYTVAPSVVFTGDGINAAGTAEINGSGEVTKIIITNSGSGYSYVNVSVVGTGSGALLTGIVSPVNGHGYDASVQLAATHAMIKQSFAHDEDGLFPAQNSYRQIGLIRNIKKLDGTSVTSTIGNKFNYFQEIQVSNITNSFPFSQKIIGNISGAEAYIFYIDPPGSTTASFFVIRTKDEFTIGETIFLEGSPATLGIVDDVINNDIDVLSGCILYLENLQYVTRKTGQTEQFIFSVEF
jgi:hypothetical protein